MEDLTILAFLALRQKFLTLGGEIVPFRLRPKRHTQDDPFDELVAAILDDALEDAKCIKAPGPLITPDMVLSRVELCQKATVERLLKDLSLIVGLEAKKLERTKSGSVARASGLDYNTTPPCGTIRVYQESGSFIDIRGFYLFVSLEPAPSAPEKLIVTGLVLCDGDILNVDFEYYLSVVGERQKLIGLGTYEDGADRNRPMVIFANPLGASELDHHVTLIHPDAGLERREPRLRRVYTVRRNIPSGGHRDFSCYRVKQDVPSDWEPKVLVDPFPTPAQRRAATQPRGRFRLPFSVFGE